MDIANEYVVCLTKYGLASVIYAAAMLILAYLLAATGGYAIAIAIPAITTAFYLTAARMRPQGDYIGDLIFSAGVPRGRHSIYAAHAKERGAHGVFLLRHIFGHHTSLRGRIPTEIAGFLQVHVNYANGTPRATRRAAANAMNREL